MKKHIIFPLIAAISVIFAGCGKKVSNDGGIVADPDTSSAATTASQENIEDDTYVPLETVRERNIISAENFDYEVVDGGVTITKHKGKDSDVVIPEEIDGKPVKEIGFYAFEANGDIISVSLPESITAIGEGAFLSCSALQQINLPTGLTEIGEGAFAGCASISEITVPAAVQRIHEGAFAGCTGLKILTVLSTELKYENWELEQLQDLMIYAPEGSAAAEWASAMGKYSVY